MNTALRRARFTDASGIVALEALFPSDRMSARTVRRFLSAPTATTWVAVQASEIVGSLVLLTRSNTRVARIYSVVVSPQARGQGLAQRLVQVAEHEARRQRRDISLEVRADNIAARGLYQKLGYAEVKKLLHFYDDGADGLRLFKRLKTA